MRTLFSFILFFMGMVSVSAMQGESTPLIQSRGETCADVYLSYRPLKELCPLSFLGYAVECFNPNMSRNAVFTENAHLVGRLLAESRVSVEDVEFLMYRVKLIHPGIRFVSEIVSDPLKLNRDFLIFLRQSSLSRVICPERSGFSTLYKPTPQPLSLRAIVKLYWKTGTWRRFLDPEVYARGPHQSVSPPSYTEATSIERSSRAPDAPKIAPFRRALLERSSSEFESFTLGESAFENELAGGSERLGLPSSSSDPRTAPKERKKRIRRKPSESIKKMIRPGSVEKSSRVGLGSRTSLQSPVPPKLGSSQEQLPLITIHEDEDEIPLSGSET